MRKTKQGLILTALLVAGILLPNRRAGAWVAVSRWGGARVVAYHPYPCYAGVGAAAVAGFAVGAAVAANSAPVYVAPAPVVVANPQLTYGAPMYAAPAYIGSSVNALPYGAQSLVVNGTQYYQAGSTWYRPYFGSNGVYYTVVSPP